MLFCFKKNFSTQAEKKPIGNETDKIEQEKTKKTIFTQKQKKLISKRFLFLNLFSAPFLLKAVSGAFFDKSKPVIHFQMRFKANPGHGKSSNELLN